MADLDGYTRQEAYPQLQEAGEPERRVALVVNNAMQGKLNATGRFTSPGAGVHTVYDSRISGDSVVLLTLYNADLPAGTHVVSVTEGSMDVVVANAGPTEFHYVVIG